MSILDIMQVVINSWGVCSCTTGLSMPLENINHIIIVRKQMCMNTSLIESVNDEPCSTEYWEHMFISAYLLQSTLINILMKV